MVRMNPSPSRQRPRSAAGPAVRLPPPSDFALLTPAQQAVARMTAYGYSPAQIAAFLRRSVGTIETHVYTARVRLGIRSTPILVRYCVTIGEVWPGPQE